MSDVRVLKWSHGDFSIEYSEPFITPHSHVDIAESFADVMYFYYKVKVYRRGELVLSTMAHDYPKVDELAGALEYMLSRDLSERYLYEDIWNDDFGYSRKSYYDRIDLSDFFVVAREYSMKIERDYVVMTEFETNSTTDGENFTLTIGKNLIDYDEDGSFEGISDIVNSYTVTDLVREDIERLAVVAKDFCEYALVSHKKDMEQYFLEEDGGDVV